MKEILSNPYLMLIMVLVLVALVVVAIYVLFPLAVSKKILSDTTFSLADKKIEALKDAIDTLGKVIPIPYISVVDKILFYSDLAVHAAEKLYLTSKIPGDARKTGAKDYVVNILTLAKIEVTPELSKVIDGAIEGSVYLLPKTNKVNEIVVE